MVESIRYSNVSNLFNFFRLVLILAYSGYVQASEGLAENSFQTNKFQDIYNQEQKMQEHNLLAFPPSTIPKPINIAVNVVDIKHISDAERYFEGTVELISHWNDSRLAFDSLQEGSSRKIFLLEAADKKCEEIWTPRISIRNLLNRDVVTKSALVIDREGHVTYRQRINGIFSMPFKTAYFPFDQQRLTLDVVTEYYDIYDIELTQSQQDLMLSGSSNKYSAKGWVPHKDLNFSTYRFTGVDGKFYPAIQAEIIVDRKPWPIVSSIFLPFLLILSAPSLMLFFIKAELVPVMASILTSILAMVALSFSVGLRLSYLEAGNIISQGFNIAFSYQFLMLLCASTLFNPKFSHKIGSKFLVEEAISFCSWFIPLTTFGLLVTKFLLIIYNTDSLI